MKVKTFFKILSLVLVVMLFVSRGYSQANDYTWSLGDFIKDAIDRLCLQDPVCLSYGFKVAVIPPTFFVNQTDQNSPVRWGNFGAKVIMDVPEGQGLGIAYYTNACCSIKPVGSASLNPEFNNDYISKNQVCGSVIDFADRYVSEQIPIDGTEFYLNHSSNFNTKNEKNRRIKFDKLSISHMVYDSFDLNVSGYGKVYDNQMANISLFSFLWDGITGNSSDNIFLSKVSYEVLLKKDASVSLGLNNPELMKYKIKYYDYDVQTGEILGEFNPNFKSIPIQTIRNFMLSYNSEVWGLKSWTISEHHYFDKESKTLLTGSGDKIKYQGLKEMNLPDYPDEDLIVIPNKENSNEYFIFRQNGVHLETRDLFVKKPIYKFYYRSDYKLEKIEDVHGKFTEFIYTAGNEISKIIAPYGQETLMQVQGENLVGVTDSVGNQYQMGYTSKSELASFKNVNGVETIFTYKDDGDFLREEKNTGLFQQVADVIQLASARVVAVVDNLGQKAKSEVVKSPDGLETTYRSNSQGQVVMTEENAIHFSSFDQELATRNIYADSIDVYKTTYESPIWGKDIPLVRRQSVNHYGEDGINENIDIAETFTVVDSDPTKLSTYVNRTQITDVGEQYLSYDINTKELLFKDQFNRSTYSYFNDKGQILRTESSKQFPVSYSYNSSGQLARVEKGQVWQEFDYDSFGFLNRITNEKGQVTTFNRDAQGKVLSKVLPNGEEIKFEYTAGGEPKKIITSSGQEHVFQMDLGDYVSAYLTPQGVSTSYLYDSAKRLKKITQPSGRTAEYVYNSASRNLDKIETTDGDFVFSNYDLQDRARSLTSPDNIKLELTYTGTEVSQQKWFDEDGSVLATLKYGFNPYQRQVDSIYLNGSLVASMTFHGGLIKTINEVRYDLRGDSGVDMLSEGFNVSVNGLTVENHNQDSAFGNKPISFVKALLPSQPESQLFISMLRSFDNFGQAVEFTQYSLNVNNGVYSKYTSSVPVYDANDRLIEVSKQRRAFVDGVLQDSVTDYKTGYHFPINSNNNVSEYTRTPVSGTQAARRTIASHNRDDQLLKLQGSINRDYQYTLDGDLKSMENCYGLNEFKYDMFSSLKEAKLSNGKIITYKTDGLNRRVKKLVNGEVTEYYLWYDQIKLAAILNADKTPRVVYFYGPESHAPSLFIKDGVTYKILHDPGLGSVRFVVNTITGEIAQEVEYDELGNIMQNENVDFQPVLYAGGLYDADTKLIRFGARDYDPTIGRWTTKDPIGFAGGDTNLYAYVGGNPMSLIDPTGTTWRDVNIINVIIGGGLVGGGATLIAGGTTTGATVIGAPLATVGVIAGTAGVLTGGAMLVNEWHNFLRPPVEFTIKNQFRPVCSVR